jgi:cytochrome oxidase Cu insertion factor (SCO1/SenC/PrrC family)
MWKKVVLGFLLLAGLALVGGYLVTGKQSTSESAVANASPESTASLAGPTSASVTGDPMPTATQPLAASPSATLRTGTAEPPVVSPSATPFDLTQDEPRTDPVEPTVEIATATPTADLPVAPVPGARAPDFTLTDLNGDEVILGELRGQAVLLNFWATW